MIWSGLLCGAILLGCHGIISAVAAKDPAAPAVLASDEDNTFRYAVIGQQNAFRLNPVPPPAPPPPPPAPDLPNVKLSGFRTERDTTWAMFAVSVKKTPRDPKETTSYMSLKEGDKGGPPGTEVELLKIDLKQEEVTIMNSGTRVVLNMKENGFDAKPTAAAAGAPGPAGLLRATPIRGNPAIPTMPGMPAPAAAPGSQAINLGAPTGGGPYSRGDMIVGGAGGVTASKTVASQPIVASSGSTGGRGLIQGGYTPPPATPTVPGLNATPISAPMIGGTPPNFAPANPSPIPPGIPMPPTPPMPSIGR